MSDIETCDQLTKFFYYFEAPRHNMNTHFHSDPKLKPKLKLSVVANVVTVPFS